MFNIKSFKSNLAFRDELTAVATILDRLQVHLSDLYGAAFHPTGYINRYLDAQQAFLSHLTLVRYPDGHFLAERNQFIAELRTHLCSIQLADGCSDMLPGGSGWVFVGYYNPVTAIFFDGPFVTVDGQLPTSTLVLHHGDRITLKVSRPVVIRNYTYTETEDLMIAPTQAELLFEGDAIQRNDLTSYTLPAGTRLTVKDVAFGRTAKGAGDALWARIAPTPH